MPSITAIKIYPLNSPLLNANMLYRSIIPVSIQKRKSWIYVMKSLVLKFFLIILKISNNIPILIPVRRNNKKVYNSPKIKLPPT